MGFLKKIDKGIERAETKYHKTKEDTKNIRKTGSKIFDFILPPLKKKEKKTTTKKRTKATTVRKGKTTTYTSGNIKCKCTSK